MLRTITLELPDALVPVLEQDAQQKGVSLEAFVQESFLSFYEQDQWDWSGERAEEERRAGWQRALDREDLWGSEEDKVWDTWTPSDPKTSTRAADQRSGPDPEIEAR